MSQNASTHPYVLGHSAHEMERLIAQARQIDPITRRFFVAAGVTAGMRVLDVGSGAGDTAFLAAELVGRSGEVVGVDRAEGAVATATARARSMSIDHVSFRVGDPAEMEFEQPFDAVLGRYVLQFQPEPAAMLRRLAAQVRPGGVVVFHELDWGGCSSFPPARLYDRACAWGAETLRRHGTESRMGIKLHATFVAAGLAAPQLRLEALLGGGESAAVLLHKLTDILTTMLPETERLQVATAAEIGLDTLFERMMAEGVAQRSVFTSHHQVGAWVRVGAPAS
jgi:SAM-dependent methyltransferase